MKSLNLKSNMENLDELKQRVEEIEKMDLKSLPPGKITELSNELNEIMNKGTNVLLKLTEKDEEIPIDKDI